MSLQVELEIGSNSYIQINAYIDFTLNKLRRKINEQLQVSYNFFFFFTFEYEK